MLIFHFSVDICVTSSVQTNRKFPKETLDFQGYFGDDEYDEFSCICHEFSERNEGGFTSDDVIDGVAKFTIRLNPGTNLGESVGQLKAQLGIFS